MIKNLVRVYSLFLLLIFFSSSLFAAIPQGYYDKLEGKSGAALKTAAFNVINVTIPSQYNDLEQLFTQTDIDVDPNTGKRIWLDMYSNFIKSAEGEDGTGITYPNSSNGHPKRTDGADSRYEKEHCLPNSWYGGEKGNENAYNDLHGLYPSNGGANGHKLNLPLGVVEENPAQFDNGCSKVGKSFQKYGGGVKVFEPADQYKGDFARTYFYMVTCYQNAAWQDTECMQMMDGSAYPTFLPWAVDMLLEWCREDPVSEKEMKRNEKVYGIQQNRNPYIDHPELVEYVWGNKKGTAWYANTENTVTPPVISPNGGDFEKGYAITVSISADAEAKIHYTLDNSTPTVNSNIYRGPLNISAATTIKAIAVENGEVSAVTSATFTFNGMTPAPAPSGVTIFEKVTDASQLVDGEHYILVGATSDFAMGTQNTEKNVRNDVAITKNVNRIEVDLSTVGVAVFTLEKKGANYALKDTDGSGYLTNQRNETDLREENTLFTVSKYSSICDLSITIGGDIQFLNNKASKFMRHYKRYKRFTCYVSGSTVKETVDLYRKLQMSELSPITATAYTKHSDFSYTANWNPAPTNENIDFYVITRKITLNGEEKVYKYKADKTSISFHMSRVAADSYEKYSVQSSRNGELSPVSNEIVIDAATSVEKVEKTADGVQVKGDYGKIIINCEGELSESYIYSMSGVLVKYIDAIYDNTEVELPKGIYLVSVNGNKTVFKVAVK